MDSSQRKNLVMGVVAGVLLVGAGLAYFWDSIFASAQGGPPIDQSVAARVSEATGATDGKPEPDSPNPPPRGSGKLRGP